jgi:hypothetical protein
MIAFNGLRTHLISFSHVTTYPFCTELSAWYEANDSVISRLPSPPSRFPYIVFLTKAVNVRLSGKHAVTPDSFMRELLEARASRAVPDDVASRASQKRDRSGCVQDRTDRAQDRAGRMQQDRAQDRAGRMQQEDRTGRMQQEDRTGRVQVRLDERTSRAWGLQSEGDNRGHSRSDALNSYTNPFKEYQANWARRRRNLDETLKVWAQKAEPSLPVPCRLCPNVEFVSREGWLHHVNGEHGGLQRYRDALFILASLSPYVVKGQEWRAILQNFSEFYARSALDWEKFTPEMQETIACEECLGPDDRWYRRSRCACVFCAMLMWREELYEVYLAGPDCFMKAPGEVAKLLHWKTYHQHWPDIPEEELKASAVNLRVGDSRPPEYQLLLLHKRRVSQAQAEGDEKAFVCSDCHDAFKLQTPQLCRFSLANHMWIGRWDPLFRKANIAHQMLLALARIVTTKVVLRPEGRATSRSGQEPSWDFLFHQSGMIGSVILFGNASCTKALPSFPPQSVSDSFAVSFIGCPPEHPKGSPDDALKFEGLRLDEQNLQQQARTVVKGIAKLKIDKAEFDEQAAALRQTNVVYKNTEDLMEKVTQFSTNRMHTCLPARFDERMRTIVVGKVV